MDSSLIASRLRLGRRIGLSGPAEAAPVDSVLPLQLPMTEEQAVAEMRARGPDVEAARAQEKSATAAILTARERYLPEINIGATLGRYDSELFPDALKRNQWNMSAAMEGNRIDFSGGGMGEPGSPYDLWRRWVSVSGSHGTTGTTGTALSQMRQMGRR